MWHHHPSLIILTTILIILLPVQVVCVNIVGMRVLVVFSTMAAILFLNLSSILLWVYFACTLSIVLLNFLITRVRGQKGQYKSNSLQCPLVCLVTPISTSSCMSCDAHSNVLSSVFLRHHPSTVGTKTSKTSKFTDCQTPNLFISKTCETSRLTDCKTFTPTPYLILLLVQQSNLIQLLWLLKFC